MKAKLWLKIWIILFLSLIFLSFLFIIYVNKYLNVPLRFTNSISFDSKLAFIKTSDKIKDTEILILGSSMGLNNINSEILSHDLNNKNILNLSSWGLKTNEILDFLKLIHLDNVKKIIYLNQYFDFYGHSINSYNEKDVQDYIYNKSFLTPYVNTFFTLSDNFKDYVEWEKRYLSNNKYSSLSFNSSGDVTLNLKTENISKIRWESVTDVSNLENHYDSLENMILYLNKKDIEFFLITTPYRNKFFKEDKFLEQYNTYISKIGSLKTKYDFKYINLQHILNLNDDFFVDSSHLNFKGASLVSEEVAKHIKESYK
ncbi:MAG: hypothetical protein ACNI3C_08775 [Candidatus Marinarcus sp.]|uniref:hypothetical protein n=1 Tax=Candidatus Marinarcus sp. TaxID=3100987 RepID=UPI003B00B8B4